MKRAELIHNELLQKNSNLFQLGQTFSMNELGDMITLVSLAPTRM